MKIPSLRSLFVAAPLALLACTADKPVDPQPSAPQKAAAAPADRALPEVATYEVKCGCSIDAVGHCGNFVMIEGQYIPILHERLGKMEWCRQKDAGAKIKASGAIEGGKFVASDWKTVE